MRKIIFLLFFMSYFLHSKILIITHAFNRPDFIPLQKTTFDSFLQESNDYEFIVFNDAREKEHRKNIQKTCKKLGIRCIEISQEIHDRPYLLRLPGEDFNHSCCRCANVVQYSLDEVGFFHDDIVMIVDSDLFLIKEFSIRNFMKGYVLAGLHQEREHINYLWNGLLFFDMPYLPDKHQVNFNSGEIDGIRLDVGGYMHYYLKTHPSLSLRLINEYYPHVLNNKKTSELSSYGITQKTMSFVSIGFDRSALLLDSTFFHYQSAGWDNKGATYHQYKKRMLNECIKNALQ